MTVTIGGVSRPDDSVSTAGFAICLALTNAAASDVLGVYADLNPNATIEFSSDSEARYQARKILKDLVQGNGHLHAYLGNEGKDREGERSIELHIATDIDTAANRAFLAKTRSKTLRLVGSEKFDRRANAKEFLLFNVKLADFLAGTCRPNTLTAQIAFELDHEALWVQPGFPKALMANLVALPEPTARAETMKRRLSDWRAYLAVLERTAEAKQFSVRYLHFRRKTGNGRDIAFGLDTGTDGFDWEKIRGAVNEPVAVRQPGTPRIDERGHDGDRDEHNDWLIGNIKDVRVHQAELLVELEDDAAELIERGLRQLPSAAWIVYKADGDLSQIRRLKSGLESLERGFAANPRLGEFLFDARQARLPNPAASIQLSRDELLQGFLNEGQLQAVEGALNAPDFFLIQGPPGTGKTTVIAEICYQNTLRGHRTLIASQANLAVDNALSRLAYHASLRALRRGRAERVEEEGQPFLEEHVVGTWLTKTAQACEQDLQQRRERVRLFEQLLQDQSRLQVFAVENQPRNAAIQGQRSKTVILQAQIDSLQVTRSQTELNLRCLEAYAQVLAAWRRGHLELNAHGQDLAHAHPDSAIGEGAGLDVETDVRRRLTRLITQWVRLMAATNEAHLEAESQAAFSQLLRLWWQSWMACQELVRRFQTVRELADEQTTAAAAWFQLDVQVRAVAAAVAQLREQAHQAVKDREELVRIETNLLQQLSILSSDRARLEQAESAILHSVQDSASTLAANQPYLPDTLGTPGLRRIWPAACHSAQLEVLARMVAERRNIQSALAGLETLSQPVEQLAARLMLASLPEIIERERPSSPGWTGTVLGNAVVRDSAGKLQAAPAATAMLAQLEPQLLARTVPCTWWQRLLGQERQRQRDLARWVLRLQAFAAELNRQQAALRKRDDICRAQIGVMIREAAIRIGHTAWEALSEQQRQAKAALAANRDRRPELEAYRASLLRQADELEQGQAERQAQQQRLCASLSSFASSTLDLASASGLRELLEKMPSMAQPAWEAGWRAAADSFEIQTQALSEAEVVLDPQAGAIRLRALLAGQDAKSREQLERIAAQLSDVQAQLADAQLALASAVRQYAAASEWWQLTHAAIPERLRPVLAGRDITDAAYLAEMSAAMGQWGEELAAERAYLARCEEGVSAWVKRLRRAESRDYGDLKQVYIDNANVIGITCSQAGAWRFSEEYHNFDCVIIDEVSKATPPDLLLPMLKGAKIILVGDHKQLPPMIGSDAIADLAIDLGVPKTDLAHLERSLFKELFEQCPSDLKVMLRDQYRMHPQIMDCINQFYEPKLVCRIDDPDKIRAHGFDLPLVRPGNHAIWISTPVGADHAEARFGTTFANLAELDIIEAILDQLDTAWASKVAAGSKRKQVAVITFYGAQVRELRNRLVNRPAGKEYKALELRVGTVDRFQGMERPVVIVSLVRNNPQGDVGFARAPERINVAFSRAQELLVIVGSQQLFCEGARSSETRASYERVASVVRRASGYRTPMDVNDPATR